MAKYDLSTRLNIKVVCIMALLVAAVMATTQWFTFHDQKRQYARQLEAITAFVAQRMPYASFEEIAVRQGAAGQTVEEQSLAVNRELQPLINDVLITDNLIKIGVYSRYHQRNVAVGPAFDRSLLTYINPDRFEEVYQSPLPILRERKSSIIWYGAPVLTHQRPIIHDGQLIGHIFASVNLNGVYAEFWARVVNTFLGVSIAMLFAIMLFQEMFIKLKKDLGQYADAIINGRAKNFESEIPELTPVLQYISEQTENMARLDRLNVIGEMAASIGHEVRNPMTTVRGFLQYLSEKEEFKGRREHFALMIEELDRTNVIISEFLSLAKNKAMVFEDADLNVVITEVAPLIQADALRHRCQITLNLGAIPRVSIDKSSIRQLLLNMVRNAIEAMPRGGTITIKTFEQEGKALLAITDEGEGIAPDLIDKLGTPFFTTKDQGIGLGLAVCYRIVQRHFATVAVESEPGRGTTFTIIFNPSGEESSASARCLT